MEYASDAWCIQLEILLQILNVVKLSYIWMDTVLAVIQYIY